MRTLKLDIVSDVVCPWCVIGFKRLQLAMRELAGELRFELDWHPFELNPHMPPEGEDAAEHLIRKYGMSAEQVQQNGEHIAAIGRQLGFTFRMAPGRRIYNTFAAHRVLYWARAQGRQTELSLALFCAYFSDGLNPSDPAVLRREAEAVGLDGEEVSAIVAEDRYAQEVRAEEERYTSAGIHAVPAYIVDGQYLISGAQEPATFVKAFRHIAELR